MDAISHNFDIVINQVNKTKNNKFSKQKKNKTINICMCIYDSIITTQINLYVIDEHHFFYDQ